jgi:hypothetical protein
MCMCVGVFLDGRVESKEDVEAVSEVVAVSSMVYSMACVSGGVRGNEATALLKAKTQVEMFTYTPGIGRLRLKTSCRTLRMSHGRDRSAFGPSQTFIEGGHAPCVNAITTVR